MHCRLLRGVRPGLEGKQRTPLSSRVAMRISSSSLSGLKGVKPPLQFGERTRHCSPGQAGKEGPRLARTGVSQGFPRAAVPVGVCSGSKTRVSGSLACGAREVRCPCACRGGACHGSRVMGGDSGLPFSPCWKKRVPSRDHGGISWFFSSCVMTCGVSLQLQRRTQGASRVAPGKSGLHSNYEGQCSIAFESQQGNRASRRVEGGISRSFSSWGRKP